MGQPPRTRRTTGFGLTVGLGFGLGLGVGFGVGVGLGVGLAVGSGGVNQMRGGSTGSATTTEG